MVDINDLILKLESIYGRPRFVQRFDPIEELISCILSQHTADANSFPTFTRLRETYPDWQGVVDSGSENLAGVIKKAGLANQKAKHIIGSLKKIKETFGDYSLDPIKDMPLEESSRFLQSLPGVGPKTAAIVQCFGFGLPAIPVDTHVHRVSRRLGLIGEKIDANNAHKVLSHLVPSELSFRFHVSLIQHGRLTCRAPKPLCQNCIVKAICPSFGK